MNGGPAFPLSVEQAGRQHFSKTPPTDADGIGMSLRDYFAAKAMSSICAVLVQGIRPYDVPKVAQDAYFIADEMLKAREA